MDADEAAVLLLECQVQREVPERHRNDRIQRVRIAGADEIAEPLIHDVDAPPIVESW